MPAADTARLVAELSLDDKRFSRGIAGAEKSLGSFNKALSRAGQGVNTAASNLGKLGAIGGGLAVAGLAASVQEASNLNEQLSKSSVVFGKASKDVIKFSETTAESLGLAQSSTLEAAGAFGNMFLTTGLAQDAAADMSVQMVTLAADMASFNNEDPTDMLDRLRSGLSGEAEPLRRFGVLLSAAAVEAEAYATGIAEAGEELTEAQKVQARYSLILKQTKVQQGDFARTSGSLANQQRILSANLRNTGAVIGTALLPKITEIAVKINKLIKENQPAIEAFAAQLPAAFDRALAFAERIPWETIGRGLEQAATWAGKLMEVFLNLPPEVQTTLIALAGLDKLSGGAITGVVSELGKGLIKGVLGMTAGVVHIKAGTVVGAGGAGGAGGGAGTLGKVAAVTTAATGAVVIASIEDIGAGAQADFAQAIGGSPAIVEMARQLQVGPLNIMGTLDRIQRALSGDFRSELEVQQGLQTKGNATLSGTLTKLGENTQATLRGNERLEAIRGQQAVARAEAITSSQGERTAIANAAAAQTAAQARTTEQARATAAAIRDKDLSVSVSVQNKVSIADLGRSITTYSKLYNVAS